MQVRVLSWAQFLLPEERSKGFLLGRFFYTVRRKKAVGVGDAPLPCGRWYRRLSEIVLENLMAA